MKNSNNIFRAIVLVCLVMVSSLFLISCEEDEPITAQELAGQYGFVSATTANEITLGDVVLPIGTDISEQISIGLFGAVTCSNPDNTALDLTESGVLSFYCAGESDIAPVQGGTWESNEEVTRLTLNLSSPPLPQAFAVNVFDLEWQDNILTGTVRNVPFPGEAFGEIGEGVGIVLVDFEMVFEVL